MSAPRPGGKWCGQPGTPWLETPGHVPDAPANKLMESPKSCSQATLGFHGWTFPPGANPLYGFHGGDKLSILTATSSCHPPHYTAFFSVRRSSTEGAEPPVGDPHHLRPVVCCRADLGLGVDPGKRKTDRFVGEVSRKVPIVGVCGHEFLESWLLGPCFGERARCRVDGSACGTL